MGSRLSRVIQAKSSGGTGGAAVSPATAAPVMDGTAAVGTSAKYAREDHVHASDTSRLALSTVTTKGDILAATGNAAVSRVGVGTDGQVLTADTASTAGVKWTTPAAGGSAYVVESANRGVDVALGSLKFRMAASGNTSMQVSTANGTATLRIQNQHNGGGAGTGLVSRSATTTPAYVNSTWNFGTSGQWQEATIEHVEEARLYRVRMEVGASYSNNTFSGFVL
jgi:hypothetical protein